MTNDYRLHPFSSNQFLPNLKMTGEIERYDTHLTISYQILDNTSEVVIPTPLESPERKDELWQETCFEFFLGVKNMPQYWEFNLSPSGNWNIYCFDGYRQGMAEETAFNTLPFEIQRQTHGLTLSLRMDLNKIIRPEQPIEVAIATVIQEKNGNITYWALTHRGQEADFHRRDSFILEL